MDEFILRKDLDFQKKMNICHHLFEIRYFFWQIFISEAPLFLFMYN